VFALSLLASCVLVLAGRPAPVFAQIGRVAISRDNSLVLRSLARSPFAGAAQLAWSPDGARLAAATDDGAIVFDTALLLSGVLAPQRVGDRSAGLPAQDVAFQPDTDRVAIAIGGRIEFWDLSDNLEVANIEGSAPIAFDVAGGLFAYTLPSGREMRMVAMPGMTQVQDLRGHTERVNDVAFSHQGNTLVSTADDGRLVVWDTASGEPFIEYAAEGGYTSAAFSPNGVFVAATGRAGEIHLINLAIATERVFPFPLDEAAAVQDADLARSVGSIAFNSVGNVLAYVAGDALLVWAIDDRGEARPAAYRLGARGLEAHFSPDGSLIVTLTEDGMVQLWGV
jgi:WD40 repeat protein